MADISNIIVPGNNTPYNVKDTQAIHSAAVNDVGDGFVLNGKSGDGVTRSMALQFENGTMHDFHTNWTSEDGFNMPGVGIDIPGTRAIFDTPSILDEQTIVLPSAFTYGTNPATIILKRIGFIKVVHFGGNFMPPTTTSGYVNELLSDITIKESLRPWLRNINVMITNWNQLNVDNINSIKVDGLSFVITTTGQLQCYNYCRSRSQDALNYGNITDALYI